MQTDSELLNEASRGGYLIVMTVLPLVMSWLCFNKAPLNQRSYNWKFYMSFDQCRETLSNDMKARRFFFYMCALCRIHVIPEPNTELFSCWRRDAVHVRAHGNQFHECVIGHSDLAAIGDFTTWGRWNGALSDNSCWSIRSLAAWRGKRENVVWQVSLTEEEIVFAAAKRLKTWILVIDVKFQRCDTQPPLATEVLGLFFGMQNGGYINSIFRFGSDTPHVSRWWSIGAWPWEKFEMSKFLKVAVRLSDFKKSILPMIVFLSLR